ncbi:class II lanthipeptide, LchA2/BrtA2 family [Paenibacillus albidus]|uniref:class II lanthipeptide, LchA2/BrtA2 family n=1 Tax=Paenibacillus albidus TaxID=2041023 RepID=UPI001BEA3CC5|nr:class II lanthipeptide, LchA2/BrtA2 family [Paenibacillus albidus]MBT2289868.1 class II lanthipeptide, LchA2/BrtA2 family [Paenibacillus albidus]
MKKNFVALEEVSEQELKDLAGGAEANWITITIPISAFMCPTTKCASIVSPCNG